MAANTALPAAPRRKEDGEKGVRASEFSAQAMGKLSLDFISMKVQTEVVRNANAKRSGFPFQN
jgi:hypothetical protein